MFTNLIYKETCGKEASKTEISLRKFSKLRALYDIQQVHFGSGLALHCYCNARGGWVGGGGADSNLGAGGRGRFKLGQFLYRKYEARIKESNDSSSC